MRIFAIVLLLCSGCNFSEEPKIISNIAGSNLPDLQRFQYGFNVDSFHILKNEIQSGESLGEILVRNGVSYRQVDEIARNSRKTDFDVRYLKADHSYALLSNKDSLGNISANVFIYEEDRINFVVYDFRESLRMYRSQKEIETKLIDVAGVIEKGSSFFLTGASLGMSDRLCEIISDEIYCWTLDFRHVQPGDKFKVIYEANYLQQEFVGVGEVKAVYFSHFDEEFYAFPFNDSGYDDYFDKAGNNLRKFFLKTPVKNSRISSRYSKSRFHPVQKRWKSHKGTDYAAKRGTPIWSTAAGVIEAASYTKYNGNYVKVRHNGTYTTQYLHMSKIAKGIHPGVSVSQGQTIGYVGSTGLATGPHVCYRFWKNGKQVDPFKSKLPPSDPISDESKQKFFLLKDSLSLLLDQIPLLESDLNLRDTINL
tara:strand:+ start:31 stop:1299 length:1269 start_codon:yes stop_codon:yes gene_type:complete